MVRNKLTKQYYDCNLLKQLRINRRESRRTVAQKTGLSKDTLYNIENGKYEPMFSSICALADYYDISLDLIAKRKKIIDEQETRLLTLVKLVDRNLLEKIDQIIYQKMIVCILRMPSYMIETLDELISYLKKNKI